jgi:hypothetical protein
MPDAPELDDSGNPFFTHNPEAHGDATALEVLDTVRTAIGIAARSAVFTISAEPDLTHAYLTCWITHAGVLFADRDQHTVARALAWELAFVLQREHEAGLTILDVEGVALAEGGGACTCPRDHELDMAACNEFVACAQRGEIPGALRTLQALERLGGDDLRSRVAETYGGLSQVLNRYAGALAGQGVVRATED